ncbi:zincin-like metallopeptidase domain-containing protein [Sphingomonas sp.]|uniref:zincin-like metallopeptidase domain-containing protein n=1 Tax=Sphingomonas sp. TaxID=28214 RepID=UPI002EDB32AF
MSQTIVSCALGCIHPATVVHGGNMACYEPVADIVRMVPFSQFAKPVGYYAVLAHELTHWSGAKARLDRDLSGRFGSEAYAMEELVAELGAAFVAGQLGLPSDPRTDHAPYIATWLKSLEERQPGHLCSRQQRAGGG